MSDGITDANKSDQMVFDEWKKNELRKFLSGITAKELVAELRKREGVSSYSADNTSVVMTVMTVKE